jgi:siroheme synthase-like protein
MADMIKEVSKNQLYPVFLKLQELKLLLVGGGNVALEKLNSLLSNSPDTTITIVAPSIREEVRELVARHPHCQLIERKFEEADLDEKDLVICATDDKDLHVSIKYLAGEKGILANVADTPDLCDFYLGSIVQKGQLKIAISTNGKSPTAAKRIREVLNDALPGELDEVIENLHKVRNSLNGDFEYKVKRMNEITKTLVQKNGNGEREVRWRKVATYSLLAFAFMLIGYFIFSYIPFQSIATGTVKWYRTLDPAFPIMLLAGFIAQLVDGALGMGYGVTSATILLSAGVSPAAMSGSIHTAEMFASGASGYSHYKFGNVNKKLFKALLIPGVLGAIAGALMLVFIGDKYGKLIRPCIAVYTLILGVKFIINAFREIKPQKKFKHYRLLAAVGGFFDSFGGGGWGPIVTSTLVNNGRSHKYVVGSVSLTEFFVTLASAFTFFTLIGVSHWQTILALIIGGLIAAPIAAKLAGKLPRRTAFMLLGALVIFWSIKILIKII